MGTLYGKYPKKITCQCNTGEMDAEAVTITLNDRCPICHNLYQICVPKPDIRMKAGSGITDAQKVEEPVLIAQKEMELMIEWAQLLNYYFNHSFSYFSYFMTLPGMFWIYTWASLIPSPEMSQARSCLSRLPSRATRARVLPRQEEIAAR